MTGVQTCALPISWDCSFLNQISRLVSNKSKHSTVDSVVEEMRDRTGLNLYLSRISANKNSVKKTAEDELPKELELPKSLMKYKNCAEDIINFIRNTIENTHGQGATIPQVQYDILHIFGKRFGIQVEDILNEEVAKYVNNCIILARRNTIPEEHNPHIGEGVGSTELEEDDKDAFAILMPAH